MGHQSGSKQPDLSKAIELESLGNESVEYEQ
jgi:hypothetical protein